MQHSLEENVLCIIIHHLLKLQLTCMCVIYTCMTYVQVHGICVSQHVLGGQRTAFESLLSPSSVSFRDQTQVVSLCNKHFYRLSHLAGPISIFLNPWWDFSLRRRNRMQMLTDGFTNIT